MFGMKKKSDVQLGDVAKDRITGLEGVVTGKTEWLNGCVRFLLQPRALHEGKPIEPSWFDEDQVEKVEAAVIQETKKTGGPRQDPKR